MQKVVELNRVCSQCKLDKPIYEYNKDPKSRGGFRAECRACKNNNSSTSSRRNDTVTQSDTTLYKPSLPYFQTLAENELPDVERLPAAYLKRAHDYWAELMESDDEPVRRLL